MIEYPCQAERLRRKGWAHMFEQIKWMIIEFLIRRRVLAVVPARSRDLRYAERKYRG